MHGHTQPTVVVTTTAAGQVGLGGDHARGAAKLPTLTACHVDHAQPAGKGCVRKRHRERNKEGLDRVGRGGVLIGGRDRLGPGLCVCTGSYGQRWWVGGCQVRVGVGMDTGAVNLHLHSVPVQ